MTGYIFGGVILILLCLVIWNNIKKDKEIFNSLARTRDLIVELEARIKKLECQDFN